MPVTAKLSRRFYDTFGDELTNELVEWFNAVDLTYRADLRDFNELNFARFDAKLEQRLAEFEAKVEKRLAEFEAKIEKRLTELETRFDRRLLELDQKIEHRTLSLRAELIKWMFVFWIGTVATFFLARLL